MGCKIVEGYMSIYIHICYIFFIFSYIYEHIRYNIINELFTHFTI
jgi:hypothetical protein